MILSLFWLVGFIMFGSSWWPSLLPSILMKKSILWSFKSSWRSTTWSIQKIKTIIIIFQGHLVSKIRPQMNHLINFYCETCLATYLSYLTSFGTLRHGATFLRVKQRWSFNLQYLFTSFNNLITKIALNINIPFCTSRNVHLIIIFSSYISSIPSYTRTSLTLIAFIIFNCLLSYTK